MSIYSYQGDKLVAANDNDGFEYDGLGNPTQYFGKTLSWSNVRHLDEITDGGESIQFAYDASGLRTHKIAGDNVSEYIYNEGRLEAEFRNIDDDEKTLYFNYGINGVSGFTLKDGDGEASEYYYRKNVQGDVTHIFDENLNLVAKYEYDAWGNHTVTNYTDGNIGDLNPIRNRSYYYDTESGLFYLKSRYYDPDTGRFINADDPSVLDLTSGDINGFNLYAYCGSNPIVRIDESGAVWWNPFTWDFGNIGNAIVNTVAVVASVAAIIVGGILVATGVGAILGGILIGAGIGSLIGGYISYNSGNSFVGGWLTGAVIGGCIGGGVAYAAPAIGSFLTSTFTFGSFTKVTGDVLTVTAIQLTGAQIAGGISAVAGLIGGLLLFSNNANRYKPKDGRSNQTQNKEFDRIANKYGLNDDQKRRLHDKISKKGHTPEIIIEVMKKIFPWLF
jgi:RHS repeat-associated protein